MARKLTPIVVQQIHARRAQGLTQAEIAAEMKLSQGSVANALKIPPSSDMGTWARPPPRVGPAVVEIGKPQVPRSEPSPELEEAEPDEPVELTGPTPQALLSMAWKTAQRLERYADAAERNQDAGAFKALAKDLIATIKELARLTPPAPPDPEQAPDMLEAARLGREALHALIDRELERAG